MRSTMAACLVVVVLLASGCQTQTTTLQENAAPEAVRDKARAIDRGALETAALFAIASHFGDSGQLSAMIAPEDAAQWADELVSIPGSVINVEQVRFEYPDYLEEQGVIGVYGDLEVLCTSLGASGCITNCTGEQTTEHYHMITLIEGDSGWVVDTIDRRSAVVSLLRMTVKGQTCLESLSVLTKAAKTFRARSQDYSVPASPAVLIPEFLDAVPLCQSGGEYSFDDNAVAVCSVHGEYRE